jgi:glutamate dehydrogenase (NADP+)
MNRDLQEFLAGLRKRNPHKTEFHPAVEEVATSVMPWYLDHAAYREAQILERLTEPDRIIIFRICWETDDGDIRANRAWRVQFNHDSDPTRAVCAFIHRSRKAC